MKTVALQDEYDCTYCIKPTRDTFHKIQKIKEQTRSLQHFFTLVIGLDPESQQSFVQSEVPAHAQAACIVQMSALGARNV